LADEVVSEQGELVLKAEVLGTSSDTCLNGGQRLQDDSTVFDTAKIKIYVISILERIEETK
jgi:hypothetical protein